MGTNQGSKIPLKIENRKAVSDKWRKRRGNIIWS